MFRRPESVLVLVYTRQGEVLLLQRADDPTFWQSVTGGLEENELAANTASRELLEETGLCAKVGDTLIDHQRSSVFEISGVWRKRYHPDQTHNREHLFSLQLDSALNIELNACEHLDSVWLSKDQAIERASSATNKQAIQDIVG